MGEPRPSTSQEHSPYIGEVAAIPACSHSDANFCGAGIRFCLMVFHILSSNSLRWVRGIAMRRIQKLRFE